LLNKKFGKSDVLIPAIGQGCDFIGPGSSPSNYTRDDIEAAVRQGIDEGMTFLDTAESYGQGQSEELIGRVTHGIREGLFLATKVAPENTRAEDVVRACESSLRRLRTDYLDLYQVHWRNTEVPISETMEAMERLVRSGKVRFVGVSNFSYSELVDASATLGETPFGSIQLEYNLFNRTAEDEFLPYCEQETITTIAYSPLDKGRVANGVKPLRVLRRIGEKYGISPGQVALSWITSHPSVVAIVKARAPQHITEVANATRRELDPSDVEEIAATCLTVTVDIPAYEIRVAPADDRSVYRTLQEALDNPLGHVPSPIELAGEVGEGMLKPTRVRAIPADGPYRYELLEGRIRYWAWVIAKGEESEIQAIVQED
jgi:diketogulonate reductase-like aldo/keto reductase